MESSNAREIADESCYRVFDHIVSVMTKASSSTTTLNYGWNHMAIGKILSNFFLQ